MKKKSLFILIGVMAGALIFSILRIFELERELARLSNTVSTNYSSLQSQISDIYSNVDDQLREQGSLLTEVSHSVGDLTDNTSPVTVTVMPKAAAADTRATLRFRDMEIPMERVGDSFTGTVYVSLFETDPAYPTLVLETGGVRQTEVLKDVDLSYGFLYHLPDIQASYSGSYKYTVGKGMAMDGELEIYFTPEGYTKLELVTCVGGKETERRDMTQDVLGDEAYVTGAYRDRFQAEFEVGEGVEVAIYLEATDRCGYIHRVLASHWLRSGGAAAEAVYDKLVILDQEGNTLYQ